MEGIGASFGSPAVESGGSGAVDYADGLGGAIAGDGGGGAVATDPSVSTSEFMYTNAGGGHGDVASMLSVRLCNDGQRGRGFACPCVVWWAGIFLILSRDH